MNGLCLSLLPMEMPDTFSYSFDGTYGHAKEEFINSELAERTLALLAPMFPVGTVKIEGKSLFMDYPSSLEGAVISILLEALNQATIRRILSYETAALVLADLANYALKLSPGFTKSPPDRTGGN